jgi:hypothetical protein
MRILRMVLPGWFILALFSCVPVEKMARHDFDSGYYKLKKPGTDPFKVYTTVVEDSIAVYPVKYEGTNAILPGKPSEAAKIKNIISGSNLYRSSFRNNSIDVDLTTIILKYRPGQGGVPNQLSSNVNAALYFGFRHDFYNVIPFKSPLKEESSYIRQIGFDAGFFAGIGITFINPTVTQNVVTQEYDGIVFQKGVAGFITFDNMSVGVTLGFDNLLDQNRNSWIYNQKPCFGLIIGISNF